MWNANFGHCYGRPLTLAACLLACFMRLYPLSNGVSVIHLQFCFVYIELIMRKHSFFCIPVNSSGIYISRKLFAPFPMSYFLFPTLSMDVDCVVVRHHSVRRIISSKIGWQSTEHCNWRKKKNNINIMEWKETETERQKMMKNGKLFIGMRWGSKHVIPTCHFIVFIYTPARRYIYIKFNVFIITFSLSCFRSRRKEKKREETEYIRIYLWVYTLRSDWHELTGGYNWRL